MMAALRKRDVASLFMLIVTIFHVSATVEMVPSHLRKAQQLEQQQRHHYKDSAVVVRQDDGSVGSAISNFGNRVLQFQLGNGNIPRFDFLVNFFNPLPQDPTREDIEDFICIFNLNLAEIVTPELGNDCVHIEARYVNWTYSLDGNLHPDFPGFPLMISFFIDFETTDGSAFNNEIGISDYFEFEFNPESYITSDLWYTGTIFDDTLALGFDSAAYPPAKPGTIDRAECPDNPPPPDCSFPPTAIPETEAPTPSASPALGPLSSDGTPLNGAGSEGDDPNGPNGPLSSSGNPLDPNDPNADPNGTGANPDGSDPNGNGPDGAGNGGDPNDPNGDGTGGDPNDPNGDGTGGDPNDPNGNGGDPNDPNGNGGDPNDPNGNGGDPNGNGPNGAGNAGDPNGDGSGPNGNGNGPNGSGNGPNGAGNGANGGPNGAGNGGDGTGGDGFGGEGSASRGTDGFSGSGAADKNGNGIPDNEETPWWAIFLIVLLVLLILIGCCICCCLLAATRNRKEEEIHTKEVYKEDTFEDEPRGAGDGPQELYLPYVKDYEKPKQKEDEPPPDTRAAPFAIDSDEEDDDAKNRDMPPAGAAAGGGGGEGVLVPFEDNDKPVKPKRQPKEKESNLAPVEDDGGGQMVLIDS